MNLKETVNSAFENGLIFICAERNSSVVIHFDFDVILSINRTVESSLEGLQDNSKNI